MSVNISDYKDKNVLILGQGSNTEMAILIIILKEWKIWFITSSCRQFCFWNSSSYVWCRWSCASLWKVSNQFKISYVIPIISSHMMSEITKAVYFSLLFAHLLYKIMNRLSCFSIIICWFTCYVAPFNLEMESD